ncbi:hypothetical protein ZOSMA_3G00020 [Zostera marina]|uniref:Uncharacterized protein n=1 Tax=Zostera marina TaxID=29655 RepID=A0A0K9P5M8_ZOSMR|nr:hypothetical protein ZOSMA_3G00020 [Zostera marina]
MGWSRRVVLDLPRSVPRSSYSRQEFNEPDPPRSASLSSCSVRITGQSVPFSHLLRCTK